MAKKKSKTRRAPRTCTTITFKRARKGGKLLPRSRWKTIRRCTGKKLRATNPKQCRRGGKGKDKHLFVKCPPGKLSGFGRRRVRRGHTGHLR